MSGDSAAPTRWKSVWAVVAGILVIFVVTTLIDVILHATHVFPPWGEPMWSNALNALALSYRLPVDVAGSWLTARLAPSKPLKHAMIGGGIGLGLSVLGVVGAVMKEFGPLWYPVALAASAIPSAWLGGWLFVRQRGE